MRTGYNHPADIRDESIAIGIGVIPSDAAETATILPGRCLS